MLSAIFWNKYFLVYDVLNQVEPYKKLINSLIETIDPKPGEKILDAGVGTGNLSSKLVEKGVLVTGLDFSPEALAIFKTKCPKSEGKYSDLTKPLSIPDETFDKIVSNNTFYNIPREKRLGALLELKRTLKPGGKIVISNLIRDFNPLKIYLGHIRDSVTTNGFFNTLKSLLTMAWPTLKMFYYNRLIQKEYKGASDNLFEINEQNFLLEQSGFINVSSPQIVYEGQAVLNSGYKE